MATSSTNWAQSGAPAVRLPLFRVPMRKEWIYLGFVILAYALGVGYVYINGLSLKALFYYGLLQPPGVTHEAAIGTVNHKELETLMARGLDEDAAVDIIIRAMLQEGGGL